MIVPIDDRWIHLLVGMAIGFVLGYFTRLVQDLREEVHEVKEELDEVKDEIEHEVFPRIRDESGFMRYPWIANIAVLLTVGLTVYAAFVSQKASNDSQASQDRIENIVLCLQNAQSQTLKTLNERSTFTKATADANIELQQSQEVFFSILLHKPPFDEARRSQAAADYFQDLQRFLTLAKKGNTKVTENPFPTDEAFGDCLRRE